MAESIETVRERYARQIAGEFGDEALLHAFARVPRERFLGPPPWRVYSSFGAVASSEDDPRALYQDALVVLSAERQINNGQPSLHARCIAALKPRAGEVVVHVGAGGGYYSAVLAELVGPDGRVHAYEVERDLAERATLAMAGRANVTVHAGSVFDEPLPRCDVLYASAGATHPPAPWLDALRPRGRMLFPMTRDDGGGTMLLIERATDGGPRDAARFLVQVQFIDCMGARDPVQARRLERAFARGDGGRVRSLRRDMPPDDSAWCVGEGWWLSTDPP